MAKKIDLAMAVAFLLIVMVLPNFSRTFAQSPGHPERVYPNVMEKSPIIASLVQSSGKMNAAAPRNSLPNSDDWTSLVYESYVDGNWEIYRTRLGGFYNLSDNIRLTNNGAQDIRPRLRLGTDNLVFASNRDGNYEIYSMSFLGGDPVRLTVDPSTDATPVWSSDGQKIAFVSDRTGNLEIFLMNADGSNVIQLTSDTHPNFSPTWSPDGKQIAWVSAVDEEFGVIKVMDVSGGASRSLPFELPYLDDLNWSPSGNSLAFDCDCNGDGWLEIAFIDVNGGAVLTPNQLFIESDNLVGSWTKRGELLGTQVRYTLYNQKYYISQAGPMGCSNLTVIVNSGCGAYDAIIPLSFYPDAQVSDVTIPNSYVLPLPTYSPARGFPVFWWGTDPGPATLWGYQLQYRNGTSGTWQD